MPLRKVHRRDVEAMSAKLLKSGLAPKTVANTLKILHGVFEHAIDLEWTNDNPVRRAARPKHVRETNPDLRFLTVEELEAVLRAIPDEIVVRQPKPYRSGRRGPAPPPPPDVLGPVLRVLILTAAMTGLRQGELLALRWRDVDWPIQRVRVRQTWRRTEFSGQGKSDLSTRRSVPLADRVVAELDAWGPSRARAWAARRGGPDVVGPLEVDGVLKDAVEDLQRVGHGLRRQSALEQLRAHRLDVAAVDLAQRHRAERGPEVVALWPPHWPPSRARNPSGTTKAPAEPSAPTAPARSSSSTARCTAAGGPAGLP
ncbi:MAG: tyrosine-type recombinase/integrase [Solirubrobacterales bacterium]|nr:tyrosine-type recombinase/integrase [Solirubrobacterales bacterium]